MKSVREGCCRVVGTFPQAPELFQNELDAARVERVRKVGRSHCRVRMPLRDLKGGNQGGSIPWGQSSRDVRGRGLTLNASLGCGEVQEQGAGFQAGDGTLGTSRIRLQAGEGPETLLQAEGRVTDRCCHPGRVCQRKSSCLAVATALASYKVHVAGGRAGCQ